MLFNSYTFLFFILIFYCLYYVSSRNLKLQNTIVLAGSYIFYGWWDERFLILIAVSTVTDYVAAFGTSGRRASTRSVLTSIAFLFGLSTVLYAVGGFTDTLLIGGTISYVTGSFVVVVAIEKMAEANRRKLYLAWSIVVNLAMLGFFKYYNFFVDSLVSGVSLIGVDLNYRALNVILPVGISFYTFQTLSYTIDVYRKKLVPTEKFIEHAAFVAFFPQLVAGPIERASNLLPQFFRSRKIGLANIKSGVSLFVWGLYKKIVIADNLSPISDKVFDNPEMFGAGDLLVGVLAFTFQIYCDFSGYSDMARGLARTLGFKLMLNFDLPYFSRTPSEFWRRWHISLSSWLRDYLYVSLGGNQRGRIITYRNLALTMLLGGLWHGAAWNFIAWGAFHGLILIGYRAAGVDKFLGSNDLTGIRSIAVNTVAWFLMFVLTMIGWVLFRVETFSDIAIFGQRMVNDVSWNSNDWSTVLLLIGPLILVQIAQRLKGELELVPILPRFVSGNLILFVLLSVFLLAAGGGQEFIYFDF